MKPPFEPITLAVRRPFLWRALLILFGLYVLGNVASIPLLLENNLFTETVPGIVGAMVLTLILTGAGLWLASRTGLGAPLIEGILVGTDRSRWLVRVVAVSVLCGVIAGLLSVIAEYLPMWIKADSAEYMARVEHLPALWKTALASIDAGVQEEIFSRLLMMSLFAWLGGLLWHGEDGRPTTQVIIGAILLSGALFGAAHIDEELRAAVPLTPLIRVAAVSGLLGCLLGWLYWKLGLECAILTHFLIDLCASTLFAPAFLSRRPPVIAAALLGSTLVAALSVVVLAQATPRRDQTG